MDNIMLSHSLIQSQSGCLGIFQANFFFFFPHQNVQICGMLKNIHRKHIALVELLIQHSQGHVSTGQDKFPSGT